MKTPDPNQPRNYGQPEQITGELIQNDDERQEVDPLNVLLTDNLPAESDDERLYTDEFIRANENASRSLFLGFLALSLLVTTLFAWFVLSRPQGNEGEDLREDPVTTPNGPLSPTPNVDIAPPPTTTSPSTPIAPPITDPSGSEAPLVFPVTPVTPNSGTAPSPNPNQTPPESSVPPPPPTPTAP